MSISAHWPSPETAREGDGVANRPDQRFPKSARLLESGDFRQVTTVGRKLGGRFFLLFSLETPKQPARLGLTVSRKVGNSVVRNRTKRLMREFFRLGRSTWIDGRDWVLIARPAAGRATADLLRQDLQKLFSSFTRPP